jgi:hypothetical protein
MISLTDAQLGQLIGDQLQKSPRASTGKPLARSITMKIKDVDVVDATDQAVRFLLERTSRADNPNTRKPTLPIRRARALVPAADVGFRETKYTRDRCPYCHRNGR